MRQHLRFRVERGRDGIAANDFAEGIINSEFSQNQTRRVSRLVGNDRKSVAGGEKLVEHCPDARLKKGSLPAIRVVDRAEIPFELVERSFRHTKTRPRRPGQNCPDWGTNQPPEIGTLCIKATSLQRGLDRPLNPRSRVHQSAVKIEEDLDRHTGLVSFHEDVGAQLLGIEERVHILEIWRHQGAISQLA